MFGNRRKSSGSSTKNAAPTVDAADVQVFVDALLKDASFAHTLTAEQAFRLALGAQQHHQMTTAYAEEFARKVRQRVQWALHSN